MALPPSTIADNSIIVSQLRLLWGTWHRMEALATASILRYTETGAVPGSGVAGTPTLVAGLSGLPCVVSQPGQFIASPRTETGPQLKEGEREFGFCDLPSAGGVAANTLHPRDRILFESVEWQVVGDTDSRRAMYIQNDTAIGYSFGTFRRVT